MELLHRLIEAIPELCDQGFLDASGGSVAVRTSKGIYVSPEFYGQLQRWNLTVEDFVLFPGEGDASMAKAGRRASGDSRIHRALLQEMKGWNFTYHGHPWGLLGFCYAQRPLLVSSDHTEFILSETSLEVPVLKPGKRDRLSRPENTAKLMKEHAGGKNYGAVLIGGSGPYLGGKDIATTIAYGQLLENAARAQHWQLAGSRPE